MLCIILEIRYCAFQQYMGYNIKQLLCRFNIEKFSEAPIYKIDRFIVTLFDLGLTLAAPLSNCTAGIIVTGRCTAVQ